MFAHIQTDPLLCHRLGRTGLDDGDRQVAGLARPRSAQEVSHILARAARAGLKVYPVSTGKNWGYGASAPAADGCVVMDLSAMDEIHHIDEELGWVEIGPGVTQGMLFEALRDTALMPDATGAGPDTSIVGNVLDGGFGHTPAGNRRQRFCVTEMVLADGTIVRPLHQTELAGLTRIGASAAVHELLVQNNLAVVTRIAFWLPRRAEQCLRIAVRLQEEAALGPYIEAIRQLKHEGILEGVPHLGNAMRGIQMERKFDFDRWDPQRGVTASQARQLQAQLGVGAWAMVTAVYGPRRVARAKAERARQLLGRLGRVQVVSDRTVSVARSATQWMLRRGLLTRQARKLDMQLEVLDLMVGAPTPLPLRSCYWRHRTLSWRPGADPVQDGCGMRWVSPALPLRASGVTELVGEARPIVEGAGFEFAITLSAPDPRTCQAILSIAYDRTNAAEVHRARLVTEELTDAVAARGWLPYRLALDRMDLVERMTEPGILRMREAIKHALDPYGVLAPGRYQPNQQREGLRRAR